MMATVVFSTIGQAVGGPLGAALGAAAGGLADQALFGRRGRKTADSLIQRSSYGDTIPRLFGTTRQAGVLVWAAPMAKGGGKGSGRSAYVMSFALLLSSAPIDGVGRIWADGREIRDANGDFAFPVKMRVHDGWQLEPDPLIAAAEEAAPAYAGRAYVVFEDFPLGEFGNRIPLLSFEVLAGGGEVSDWLQALTEDVRVDGSEGPLPLSPIGYTADGTRVAEDAEVLVDASGYLEISDANGFRFSGDVITHALPDDDVVPEESGASLNCATFVGKRPSGYAVGYLDPERDYQAGMQSVVRRRSGKELEDYTQLVMNASDARFLAGAKLRKTEDSCETLSLRLPWKWLHIGVGHVLDLGERLGRWCVQEKTIDGSGVKLSMVRFRAPAQSGLKGDSGRVLASPMQKAGETRMRLVESPVPIFENEAGPWLIADGRGAWRGSDILIDSGDGERALGRLSVSCPLGQLTMPLPAGGSTTWDETSVVYVEFDSEVLLESRDAESVLAGANLLMIDEEFLKFRRVDQIGDHSYRLSGLVRGCFATEYASLNGHVAGSMVSVVRRDGMLPVALGVDQIGRNVDLRAVGPGDPAEGTLASFGFRGVQYGALAPVHVHVSRLSNGAVLVTWIPRSPDGWSWNDMVFDVAGTIHFHHSGGSVTSYHVSGGSFRLDLAEQMTVWGERFSGWIEFVSDGPAPLPIKSARTILE